MTWQDDRLSKEYETPVATESFVRRTNGTQKQVSEKHGLGRHVLAPQKSRVPGNRTKLYPEKPSHMRYGFSSLSET